MKILFIGDTVGKPGCAIVQHHLKYLQEEFAADLTILNCENAASGFGVTPKIDALSALLVVASVLLVSISALLQRRDR